MAASLLRLALLLSLAASPLAAEPAAASHPPLAAGVLAPDFTTFDLAGQPVTLADYRGRVLILDFWATWCSPCIASMPHTQALATKYADQGVAVLAVCTGDKRPKFEDWVKLRAKTYPAMRFTFDPHESGTPQENDRASVALYGVPAIPCQFVIDRTGRIAAVINGYVPGDHRLEAGLAQAGIKVDAALAASAAAQESKIASARAGQASAPAARPPPPPFTEDAVRLKAGATVSDLVMQSAEGAPLRLSHFRGRPLVLSFSPAEMIPADFLDRATERFGPDGVQVLALVTRDSAESFRDWQQLHRGRHRFTTALDPSGPDAIRESAVYLAVGMVVPMPMVLVLDAEGRLVGKVAPKVATSTLGLAELLRRTGVKVRPEELPPSTPAATPAPAPKVTATGSTADQDLADLAALRRTQPPAKASELGMANYLRWMDEHAKQITAAVLAFHQNHPTDPRRWDTVMPMLGLPPLFALEYGPDVATRGASAAVIDEKARQAWTAQAEQLKQALLAAPDSTPEQKEAIGFQDFAAESRRRRARLKAGEENDARAAWLELRERLDRHLAKHAGLPRLAGEADNFLTAWKDLVPGSYEEGWQHFLQAPDEAVRKTAAEKLESRQRLSRPITIAFTAVDGRKVDLRDLRGKVVLVDFWATWCGPCVAELPNVRRVYAAYHDQGFEVVGITLENAQTLPSDSPEQAAEKMTRARARLAAFVAREQLPWPQHFDGKYWKNEFATQFGISAIPAMFLLDAEGRVASTQARGESLEREVRRLLQR